MPSTVTQAADVRLERPVDSETVASVAAGDTFEVLEIAGGSAWGIAVAAGVVGYMPLTALGLEAA